MRGFAICVCAQRVGLHSFTSEMQRNVYNILHSPGPSKSFTTRHCVDADSKLLKRMDPKTAICHTFVVSVEKSNCKMGNKKPSSANNKQPLLVNEKLN
jgi:hypothetical protein